LKETERIINTSLHFLSFFQLPILQERNAEN